MIKLLTGYKHDFRNGKLMKDLWKHPDTGYYVK